MCGISGAFSRKITDNEFNNVKQVMESQKARGPDYQAIQIIRSVRSEIVFAHNRLSIIDLSDQANQPMWDATSRFCVIFNGEIYNYIELRSELENSGLVFKTQSDTEVILNAFAMWGIEALNRFKGPFAFALYDHLLEELWLCRDRFGVRPLFYYIQNNILYFASTTATLAKIFNLKPNLEYVSRGLKYLVYENGSEMGAYHHLKSVPSAHYLRVSHDEMKGLSTDLKQYYDLPKRVETVIDSIAPTKAFDLLKLIQENIETAVNIRLRADVPLAISLSGGLDSSSIAALIHEQHESCVAFSFSHPENLRTEGPLVAQCARHMNIRVEYVWPTQQEMIAGLFKTLEAQDAPFASLSVVAQYLLYEKVRACGIKVLLGGQGGDESFMGYRKFLLFWMKKLLQEKKYFSMLKNFLQWIPMMLAEVPQIGLYWRHRHRYSRRDGMTNYLQLPPCEPLALNSKHQILWQRQMLDITEFSLPTLLRYEDRNGMGNSVESRLPYMDHELVELGIALPE